MRRWSDTPPSDPPARSSERLFERLPEFYREHPGYLRSLVDVADDLVAATRAAFAGVADTLRPHASDRSQSRRGALGDVLRSLPSDWPTPRAVWHHASVRRLEGDVLVIRHGHVASVVLLWEEADLEGCSREPTLRAEDYPVGARLQVVVVRRLPARLPIDGARLHGEVLWQ